MKVELRAIEPEDIDVLYKWENDKEIWKVSNTIVPFSRYVLTKYIESAHLDIYQTKQLRLMIDVIQEETRTTVGAIDLFDFEPYHLRAGVGIVIGEKASRGQGIADAAIKELIHYAFKILQLKQVYCNILCDNQTSLNLFKKNGFKEIGVKQSWVKTETGYIDEYMLQLVQSKMN